MKFEIYKKRQNAHVHNPITRGVDYHLLQRDVLPLQF